MKNKLNIKTINRIINVFYFLLLIVITYMSILICKEFKLFNIFINIIKLLSPLFIGLIIAYLLNPLVNKFTLNRKISVCIIYFFIIVTFIILIKCIYPTFKKEFFDFLRNLPYIIDNIDVFVMKLLNNKININVSDYLINFINNNILNKVSNILVTIKNIAKIFGVIILSLIISFYLLLDFENINNIFSKIINKNKYNELLTEIDEKIFSYIKGTLLIAVFVYVISCILFKISGLKGPIFFGLFNSVTNIIPYIGPYIGGIPILIIAFSESKKVGYLTLFFVIFIQVIESYILHPIIMSKSLRLHPVSILISLLLFGYFFGIIGMVIAMPVVSIIKTIIIYAINESYYFMCKQNLPVISRYIN